ncbi:MAG TPA: YdbH domain-containing protein [Alphaproteobacteria bacterium]|nr:YdbH domain-containing protein [Alphaproteobacteria bacterium]
MPTTRFSFPLLFVTLAIVLALAVITLPWKTVVEEKLKAALEEQGFHNVQLKVESLGFKTIKLQDISVGAPQPLVLKNVTLNYSVPQLWKGHFGEVIISGLDVVAHQEGKQWVVKGLEGLSQAPSTGAGFALPNPQSIPFRRAQLENSTLRLEGPWHLELPLNITWQKRPSPEVSYQGANLNFKSGAMAVTAGQASAHMALQADKKLWKGEWQVKNVAVKGAATPLPVLNGGGELQLEGSNLLVSGNLASADKTYAVNFRVNYAGDAPEKSELVLQSAVFPWNNGRLSVAGVNVPLGAKREVLFPIKVEHVSVDALMQTLTGKQATGTGAVSGSLPVIIKPDGSMLIQKGSLQAEAPGKITLSPEAIPGDNEQVALVRDILKDINYKLLSIETEGGQGPEATVIMKLEGYNPAVYNGRPVKLNVRLTGDVLNLVQQSIMPLLDPRVLLKQDKK